MEINLGNLIIGLIMTFIFISPFVILHYKRVKKEKEMLQNLNAIAQQYNCKVSNHEFCGDFVIGIDEGKNFVFFFKQKKEETISQFVDLAEIKTCQIVINSRNIKNEIGNLGFTELVELAFTSSNKSNAETKFELYDQKVNIQLSGELQIAEKWVKRINDLLNNKK